jgi:hypothetical protein
MTRVPKRRVVSAPRVQPSRDNYPGSKETGISNVPPGLFQGALKSGSCTNAMDSRQPNYPFHFSQKRPTKRAFTHAEYGFELARRSVTVPCTDLQTYVIFT